MLPDFAHFSFNQLKVLKVLIDSSQTPVSVAQISQKTNLKGKSLGAVLSSLSRNKTPLIRPAGKALSGGGLRWQINTQLIDPLKTLTTVKQILSTYA